MTARDPLAAIPFVTPATESRELEAGEGLLLFRAIEPGGRLTAWLAEKLGWKRERAFELDALGARFYRQIDGRRPLAAIERALRAELGLPEAEVRRAVVAFTGQLMQRGLVALRLPGEPEPGEAR